MMRRMLLRRTAAALVSVCMMFLGLAQAAHAGVIGTQAAAASAERTARIGALQSVIMSRQVSDQLVALGVNPVLAAERVSSMTDEEVARLSANIEHAPAGAGIVEVVGVVFIVLLILEFTGVIDIFKKPDQAGSK